MNYPEQIKDVIDFLNELHRLSAEDATNSVNNKQQQNEQLLIAYTFSKAAASLSAMAIPHCLASVENPVTNKVPIIHVCLIQKLLSTIGERTEKGLHVDETEYIVIANGLQKAIECYMSLN